MKRSTRANISGSSVTVRLTMRTADDISFFVLVESLLGGIIQSLQALYGGKHECKDVIGNSGNA